MFALSLSKGPSVEEWFDGLTTNGASNVDIRKEVLTPIESAPVTSPDSAATVSNLYGIDLNLHLS